MSIIDTLPDPNEVQYEGYSDLHAHLTKMKDEGYSDLAMQAAMAETLSFARMIVTEMSRHTRVHT